MFCLLFFYFGRAFIALPFYFHFSHYMKKISLDMCKTLPLPKQNNLNLVVSWFGLFYADGLNTAIHSIGVWHFVERDMFQRVCRERIPTNAHQKSFG